MLFKQSLSIFLIVNLTLGFLTLSGCSSLTSKKALYEGEVADAATIRSFDTVQVDYIDNKPMAMSFVGQIKEYGVLPGQHTLIVRYADFWSLDSGDDEKVTSPPVKITFTAEPNQTYQIQHKSVPSFEQSKVFAGKPVLLVKNVVTGSVVAADFELAAPKSFMSGLRFASTPDYQFSSEGVAKNSAVESGVVGNSAAMNTTVSSTLGSLQQLWGTATKEEKAHFLQWITVK